MGIKKQIIEAENGELYEIVSTSEYTYSEVPVGFRVMLVRPYGATAETVDEQTKRLRQELWKMVRSTVRGKKPEDVDWFEIRKIITGEY